MYSSLPSPRSRVLLIGVLFWAISQFASSADGISLRSLGGIFNGSDNKETFNITSINDYGPVMVKTMLALSFLKAPPNPPISAQTSANISELAVPYGTNSSVLVRRDSLNSLYIVFQDNDLQGSVANWATNSTAVPFLKNFVYTSQAPAALITAFNGLTGSNGTVAGPLTRAVEQVMAGERILWVTCSGEGAGGGLALLCGVASALYFPGTSVDVITFNTPWQGFNPQFSWSFNRLITLFYLWPFNTTAVPALPQNLATADVDALRQGAQSLQELISAPGTLQTAVTVPNLPAALPSPATELTDTNVLEPTANYDDTVKACEDSFPNGVAGLTPTCIAGSPKIKDLTPWAPALSLPPPGQLPPSSSCPPIICRSVPYLDMSCNAFGTDTSPLSENSGGAPQPPPPSLGGLPYLMLHDNRTSADAIVAWNDTSKEAIFLFKYTNESRDWAADALAYRTDDFKKKIEEDFPGAKYITDAVGDPQVHAGFYNQFESLLDAGVNELNFTTALQKLNNGQDPLYIVISGFSLGGAVSELAAVWASYKWPLAHILVVTQGAPKVGEADYVTWYASTAGVAWRYQFNLDQVPTLPPLAGYRTTREPIWITSQMLQSPFLVLFEPRPEMSLSLSTWYDHWCNVFYVPILKNTTSVSIPSWVYTAPAA